MISFLAQSLDNESPNSITLDGKIILPSEEEKREEILSGIYDIASEKTKIKSVSGVTMYCKASRFVFEVIPLDKDIADRLSPIIILGDFPKEQFSDVWVNDVCDQLVKFASEVLGRTISDSILDIVKEWLSSEMFGFKKKTRATRRVNNINSDDSSTIIGGMVSSGKVKPTSSDKSTSSDQSGIDLLGNKLWSFISNRLPQKQEESLNDDNNPSQEWVDGCLDETHKE